MSRLAVVFTQECVIANKAGPEKTRGISVTTERFVNTGGNLTGRRLAALFCQHR